MCSPSVEIQIVTRLGLPVLRPIVVSLTSRSRPAASKTHGSNPAITGATRLLGGRFRCRAGWGSEMGYDPGAVRVRARRFLPYVLGCSVIAALLGTASAVRDEVTL